MQDTRNRRSYPNPSELGEIYAQLPQEDIEQFYADYQLWTVQQRIATLQNQIDALHQQILENTERMNQAHPSAIALAALARLQASGVSDTDLLDCMLERGEDWLDHTMQRLDYCEQLEGFMSDDYTQWCKHALEGAYDWIDSMRDADANTDANVEDASSLSTLSAPASTPSTPTEESLTEATEELLLQKLTSDEEEEDEEFFLETTLKRPVVTPSEPEEHAPDEEEQPPVVEEADTTVEETVLTSTELPEPEAVLVPQEPLPDEGEEPLFIEESPISDHERLTAMQDQEPTEITSTTETDIEGPSLIQTRPQPAVQWEWTIPSEVNAADIQQSQPKHRANFIWRLLAKIWGR